MRRAWVIPTRTLSGPNDPVERLVVVDSRWETTNAWSDFGSGAGCIYRAECRLQVVQLGRIDL